MKKITSLIILMVSLISCEKESSEFNSANLKPRVYIFERLNNIDTSTIYYNGNRVDYIDMINEKIVFEYKESTVRKIFFKINDLIPYEYTSYVYNVNNKITRIEYYSNTNFANGDWVGPMEENYALTRYFEFEYLSDGTVKKQYLLLDSNKDVSDYSLIKYDVKGNIELIKDYIYMLDSYQLINIDSFLYDNKKNPFINVNLPRIPLDESTLNNVIEEHSTFYSSTWGGTNGYNVTDTTQSVNYHSINYNNLGFPTKIINDDYSVEIFY